jgi:hypothetical protein
MVSACQIEGLSERLKFVYSEFSVERERVISQVKRSSEFVAL